MKEAPIEVTGASFVWGDLYSPHEHCVYFITARYPFASDVFT